MKFETLQQYAGACLSALEVQFPQFTWTRKAWRDDGPGVSVEITYTGETKDGKEISLSAFLAALR